MNKNILIGFLGVLLIFGMLATSCGDSETWGDEQNPNLTLSKVTINGIPAVLGKPGGTPASAIAGSVTLVSGELDVDGDPTLVVYGTINATQAASGSSLNYAHSTSAATPGDFSSIKPTSVKDGDFLWIKVTFGNAVSYYCISIHVGYDPNAYSGFIIIQNPVSRVFTLSEWNGSPDSEKTLSVELSEPGTYQYQWYSNTIFSNTGGSPVGTEATYTPDISVAGDYFYYVAVTRVAMTVTSFPTMIKITDAAVVAAPLQFALNADRLNYIRGVGGTGAFMFRTGDNADPSPDVDVTYIDRLMGELGLNVLRIMVQDDYENYLKNTVQNVTPRAPYYHDAQANFYAVIKRVNEYGGYVFANPWTAPARMKSNNDTSGANAAYLLRNSPNYVDYAEHLRNFLKLLNENNAPIFALGIQNEPDYGGGAYEGMNWSGENLRDWFMTTGHFPTQQVNNRSTASTTNSTFSVDIIPGFGGGRHTHHVLSMNGDPMGNMNGTYDSALASTGAGGANNRIELMGRHYYAGTSRYTTVADTTGANTLFINRPQLNYIGPYEAASLAISPQMFHPGASAGSIKREIWQSEHDYNYHEESVEPPTQNTHHYWNSVFAAMNTIDYTFRVAGESVHDWWYSQSFSGYVSGIDAKGWPSNYSLTPRGIGAAHFARYVNETWLLGIERTKGAQTFNPTSFNAGHVTPVFSGYEDTNGKFISIVMFTPMASTNSNGTSPTTSGSIGGSYGQGGTNGLDNPTLVSVNVGRVEIVLPEGFVATGATAIRSYGRGIVGSSRTAYDPSTYDSSVDAANGRSNGQTRYWFDEPVFLRVLGSDEGGRAGRSAVEVTLPGGNIISIKVTGEWTGVAASGRHFEERVRPWDLVQSGRILLNTSSWPN